MVSSLLCNSPDLEFCITRLAFDWSHPNASPISCCVQPSNVTCYSRRPPGPCENDAVTKSILKQEVRALEARYVKAHGHESLRRLYDSEKMKARSAGRVFLDMERLGALSLEMAKLEGRAEVAAAVQKVIESPPPAPSAPPLTDKGARLTPAMRRGRERLALEKQRSVAAAELKTKLWKDYKALPTQSARTEFYKLHRDEMKDL